MMFVKCLVMAFWAVTIFVGSANAGYADPNQFWTKFRQAVIDNDINTIISLTHFPFKVRGTDDSDPILEYNRKGFPNLYKKLVSQKEESMTITGRFESKTMLELIKEKKKIEPKELLARDFLRVYDFEFTKINGVWFFTFGYLDE